MTSRAPSPTGNKDCYQVTIQLSCGDIPLDVPGSWSLIILPQNLIIPHNNLNLAHTYEFPSHKKENTEKSLELGHRADNTPRLRSCLNAMKSTFLLPVIARGLKLLPTHPFTVYFPPHRYRPLQNNAKMLKCSRISELLPELERSRYGGKQSN